MNLEWSQALDGWHRSFSTLMSVASIDGAKVSRYVAGARSRSGRRRVAEDGNVLDSITDVLVAWRV